MNKEIIKHLLVAAIIFIFCISAWLCLIYNSFVYKINLDVKSSVLEYKQSFVDIVKNKNVKDRINKLNKNFLYYSILDKEKKNCLFENARAKDKIISKFYFTCPIIEDNKILCYVNIWPSYNFTINSIFNKTNFVALLFLFILLIVVLMLIFRFYILKFLFAPIEKLKEVLGAVSNQRKCDFEFAKSKSIWKNIFENIKNLNTKIIDVKTTIKLLFTVTNIVNSDIEFVNSIHLIFNILQQKVNNSAICVLYLLSSNGDLKVFAKDYAVNDTFKSINYKSNSVIWECFQTEKEYIVKDLELLSKKDRDLFDNNGIVKQINVPILDNRKNKCNGVFFVGLKDERYFDNEIVNTVKQIARCFSILISYRDDSVKIKEINRKLKTENQTTSDYFLNTNVLLLKKSRTINAICNIEKFVLCNFETSKIIPFIIEEIKNVLYVKTVGMFIYNKNKKEFCSISGSFGINKVIKIKDEDNFFANEIFHDNKSLLIPNTEELKKYPSNDFLSEYFEIDSLIATSLKDEKGFIGMLVAVNKIGIPFSTDDIKTLEELSFTVSSAIDKIKLYNNRK